MAITNVIASKRRGNKNHEDVCNDRLKVDMIIDKPNASKILYMFLQNKEHQDMVKYLQSWSRNTQENWDEVHFYRLFIKLGKITNIVKLKDFQYWLLLNKIYTNETLQKWGIVDSCKCEWCGKDGQTIAHIMWYCKYAQNI